MGQSGPAWASLGQLGPVKKGGYWPTTFFNQFNYLYYIGPVGPVRIVYRSINDIGPYIVYMYIGERVLRGPTWPRLDRALKLLKSKRKYLGLSKKRGWPGWPTLGQKGVNLAKEAYFSGLFVKVLRSHGFFAYKIPDAVRGQNTRFIPTKPFDVVFMGPKVAGGVEWKLLRGKPIFKPADHLRPSQVDGLNDLVSVGKKAFVGVAVAIPRGNYFVMVPWVDIRDMMNYEFDVSTELLWVKYYIKKESFDFRALSIDMGLNGS